jgi:hypothetical protein
VHRRCAERAVRDLVWDLFYNSSCCDAYGLEGQADDVPGLVPGEDVCILAALYARAFAVTWLSDGQ